MRLKSYFVFLLFNTIVLCSNAANGSRGNDSTYIFGINRLYAGAEIEVLTQPNVITSEFKQVASVTANSQGSFRVGFLVNGTSKVFLKMGKTIGSLVVTSSGSYEVALPPYQPMNEGDKMNPFFTPDLIPLAILTGDKEGLNRQVALFDDAFNSMYVDNLQKIIKSDKEPPILKVTNRLDSLFPTKNQWFKSYKTYSYYKFYELAFPRRREYIIDKFFTNATLLKENEAFVEAFNLAFFRYFALKFDAKKNLALVNSWKSRDIDSINIAFERFTILKNREMREAVILKNLYDAYYSDMYNKDEISMLVEQASHRFKSLYCKELASGLLANMLALRAGSIPPTINLQTLDGKTFKMGSFKGKFIYLNFMNSQNYACKKDLLSLAEIRKISKKDVEIVSVFTDTKIESVKEFVKKNKIDWTILTTKANNTVLNDYRIKVLPTYFLINPEGRLVLSPAPSPEENFLSVFEAELKAYQNKELRKNPPKAKSIFDM